MTRLARLRGLVGVPQVAILLVATMLYIDYRTFRDLQGWRWPVEVWQMYAGKTNRDRRVLYRRFLELHADGRHIPSDLADPISFLRKPYRIDAGLDHNLPGLLVIVLREMQTTKRGADLLGITYEKRTWLYGERTLAEHLRDERPDSSFRVMATSAPAAALRIATPANLLANGGFDGWDAGTGTPNGWELDKKVGNGLGVDTRTDDHCLFLPAAFDGTERQVLQKWAPPPGASAQATRLHAAALFRTGHPGAYLELLVGLPGGETVPVRSVGVPADGAWHRVEVGHELGAGVEHGSATVILHAGGDTFVDDVSLERRTN